MTKTTMVARQIFKYLAVLTVFAVLSGPAYGATITLNKTQLQTFAGLSCVPSCVSQRNPDVTGGVQLSSQFPDGTTGAKSSLFKYATGLGLAFTAGSDVFGASAFSGCRGWSFSTRRAWSAPISE